MELQKKIAKFKAMQSQVKNGKKMTKKEDKDKEQERRQKMWNEYFYLK